MRDPVLETLDDLAEPERPARRGRARILDQGQYWQRYCAASRGVSSGSVCADYDRALQKIAATHGPLAAEEYIAGLTHRVWWRASDKRGHTVTYLRAYPSRPPDDCRSGWLDVDGDPVDSLRYEPATQAEAEAWCAESGAEINRLALGPRERKNA